MKSYLQHINDINVENLPVLVINENWLEGSEPRYQIGSILNTAKSYFDFIKKSRKIYLGKKVLLCHIENNLSGGTIRIYINTIN